MKFDQPRSLRQSMSWLHTWSGLLLGWLLFAIFVTGTLSFFRNEITFWMQPELHRADKSRVDLDAALRILEKEAPRATQWSIVFPSSRNPTLGLSWQNPDERQARGGHHRGPRLVLDPASGERLQGRETAGGEFLYRFHFELHGMDRLWGRWIVGIATMFMFVAIISGVIVHRHIFRDFFTFRPAKGKRSWLDAHNASSVLSLPFHVVITFSSLLLFGHMMLPSAAQSAYGGDMNAFMRAMRVSAAETPPAGERAPLTPLAPLVDLAHAAWKERGIGSLIVINPGDRHAIVEIRQPMMGGALADGRNAVQSLRFDGATGQALDPAPLPPPTTVQTISNVLIMLHRGFFATPVVRWLLFLAGVGGSLMVATGMVMWSRARAPKRGEAMRPPFGHRLVEIANVAGIAGLLLAIGAYFWANRLLPADLPLRGEWEIRVFFIVWGATLAHAALRARKAAWVEQLVLAGVLAGALPLLNACSGGLSLLGSLAMGQGLLAGFDLCALFIGLGLLHAARKVRAHVPRASSSKPAPLETEGAAP
jgi:uncharacterized iron-regulated membrane protein